MDSDCPQLESGGNTNRNLWSVSLFSHTQVIINDAAIVTCVDVKELALLESLLLLLFCRFLRQLGLLELLFSLLPLLILLHRLLVVGEEEKISDCMYAHCMFIQFLKIKVKRTGVLDLLDVSVNKTSNGSYAWRLAKQVISYISPPEKKSYSWCINEQYNRSHFFSLLCQYKQVHSHVPPPSWFDISLLPLSCTACFVSTCMYFF